MFVFLCLIGSDRTCMKKAFQEVLALYAFFENM